MTVETKSITRSFVEAALGLPISGSDRPIQGFTTDSREAGEGFVFLAVRGERVDGNDYIASALQNGAAFAIGQKTVEGREDRVLTVQDTVASLGKIAAAHKASLSPRTVGVTGSVGKTTSKELIYAVLSQKFLTHKTEGNHNNEIGLPLSLLTLDDRYEAAVYEMGMSAKGEISYLTSIVRPDVAVITNIGSMHIEFLGSREAIRDAKLEIREGLPGNGGLLVLNGDEPLLEGVAPALRVGVQNPASDLFASRIQTAENGGLYFDLRGPDFLYENLFLPVSGKHNVQNAAMAVAVGQHFALSEEEIRTGLASYRPCGMRQNLYDYGGITILEDCYNAGPESVKASLSVLSEIAVKGERRSIAVLGDMRELGSFSESLHREVGKAVAEAGVSLLYTVGDLAAVLGEEAARFGVTVSSYGELDPQTETVLAQAVAASLRAGDCILFKGSRSLHLETLLRRVKELLPSEQNNAAAR